MTKKEYERVDVTFSKKNEIEIELYKYIEENAGILGKAKFIKQVLLDKMNQDKTTKK